ncbi:MAG: glycoside hydrolase family 3 protein, partial [Thermoanaerobaculia bacterium]
VGQLFVVAAHGTFMNEGSPEYGELLRQVRENHVGGVCWFLSNVYETAHLNRRLQAAARTPLLISADLESGIGMRFVDTTYWPWAMGVAAAGDPALAERQGQIEAEEARALGLNQIYAPVADVNVNPDNTAINVRSYGEDPADVARYVAAFVRGVESGGVLATAKHFPGHGDTRTDSHRSLPLLDATRERLERVELVPFRAAISAGVSAVMVGHLSLPALDATPAPAREGGSRDNPYTNTKDSVEVAVNATVPSSLSPAIVDGLLRRELQFRGLVVVDAADMGALTDHFDAGETAVRAILAGADQVPKSYDTDGAIAAVKRAVLSGRITEARLDLSVERILAAKARAGAPDADPEKVFRQVDSLEHRAVAEEIARRSLTLLREEAGSLPLARGLRLAHLVVSDTLDSKIAQEMGRQLARRLDRPPETFVIDPRSNEEDVRATLEGVRRAEVTLVSLFVRFQSGRGRIALPALGKSTLEKIEASGARVIAVSFGTPYLLRELPGLRTYVAAYGGQPVVQAAAARALFGEAGFSGRLPVTIPGAAARGDGIQKPPSAQSAASDFPPRRP